jgi:lipopolysaccharide biosynthesis regulator YciM
MEFEYWWLLALPLFFAFGWFARGRERSERRDARAAANLPAGYLKGIHLLLDERPDAAIDAFTEVARIAPEAVDLHFALGALFRRRGETDRAIRVHRNLIERGGLGEDERNRARFALGEDYLKAGLIDRAEAAFDELAGTPLASAAARQRLEIARMTRDWPRVIALAEELPDADPGKALVRLHAHCELAEVALDEGRLEQAATEIQAALAAMPSHPRGLISLARLESLRGHTESALAVHERLADSHPGSLPLHAADWLERAGSSGLAPVLGLAMARIEAVPGALASPDVLRPLALARARADSLPDVIAWLEARLVEHPSLLGMQTLLELLDRENAPAATSWAGGSGGAGAASAGSGTGAGAAAGDRDERAMLQGLVKRQAEHQSRFVCSQCGFRARRHYWQCPGCSRWDSYPPSRQE